MLLYYMQAPLGIIMKNENIVAEMIEIMDEAQTYVPFEDIERVDETTNEKYSSHLVHKIVFGGDQLTRKRAETAIKCRKNSSSPKMRLDGLLPVCEDWHAKKVLLEVCVLCNSVFCMYYIR